MKLEELFEIVSDEQEVRLIGDAFDEIKGFKSTMEAVLSATVLKMRVDCVEASFEGELKVWVKDDADD